MRTHCSRSSSLSHTHSMRRADCRCRSYCRPLCFHHSLTLEVHDVRVVLVALHAHVPQVHAALQRLLALAAVVAQLVVAQLQPAPVEAERAQQRLRLLLVHPAALDDVQRRQPRGQAGGVQEVEGRHDRQQRAVHRLQQVGHRLRRRGRVEGVVGGGGARLRHAAAARRRRQLLVRVELVRALLVLQRRDLTGLRVERGAAVRAEMPVDRPMAGRSGDGGGRGGGRGCCCCGCLELFLRLLSMSRQDADLLWRCGRGRQRHLEEGRRERKVSCAQRVLDAAV